MGCRVTIRRIRRRNAATARSQIIKQISDQKKLIVTQDAILLAGWITAKKHAGEGKIRKTRENREHHSSI